MDITETLAPKSDQLNAEDLLTGPRTFTVEKVTKGSTEQPVEIHLVEFPGRPFKPSKTVRRLIAAIWGVEASDYVGRRMTLYRDPDVKFGGMDVGGIRMSHASHLDKPVTIALAETRAKRKAYRVDPLPAAPAAAAKAPPTAGSIINAFAGLGVSVEQLEKRLGVSQDGWDATDIETLAGLGRAIKAGETTVDKEFSVATSEPEPSAVQVDSGPASDEQLAKLASLRGSQGYDGDDAGWYSLIGGLVNHSIKSDNDITASDVVTILAVFAEESE